MTRLRHTGSQRQVTLGSTVVVGRSSRASITLDDPMASRMHATLQYDSAGWSVRDLCSANGTWVDGARLATGGRAMLRAGAVLRFADDVWCLLDDDPPVAAAHSVDERRLADGDLLALPNPERPTVTIYFTPGSGWFADEDGTIRAIGDGETLLVAGQRWTVELPPSPAPHATHSTVAHLGGRRAIDTLTRLILAVSRDEETTEAELRFERAEPVQLSPQSFNYLLVVLARARLADRDAPLAEQGWMYTEDACRELGVEPDRLNVEVYRCRKRLAGLGVEGATSIVERRAHTRQIRIGVDCAEVVPLG